MVVSAPAAAVAALGVLLAAAPDGGVPSLQPRPEPLPPLPPPSLLAPLPSLLRATPEETYKLRESKDGSGDLIYEASTFSARVAPDGGVTFKDRSISDFKWLPFLPRKNVTFGVPSLESSIKNVLRGRDPPPPPRPDERGPPPETTAVIPEVSRYRPDPREACRECKAVRFDLLPGNATGRLDLTDELMRMNGQDPYRYQKAKFLAATRERRVQMAAKTHAQNLRSATADLPARLRSIACDNRLSLRERRAVLEALRHEMDAGTPEGHEAAGKIAAFIAARFDADGGDVCPAP
jgi:hypothetical protein